MRTIFELIIVIILFSVTLKLKRIFKLRSELVFCAIVSGLISFMLVVFLKEYILGSFLNNSKDTPIYIHRHIVSRIEDDLKNMDINNSSKLQKYMDREFNMSCYIFVVKKDGRVIAANNREIKNIDIHEIADGKNTFKFLDTSRDNIFKITRCDYLKDGYYLYYIYIGYGKLDTENSVGILWIVTFAITFFLLIWKRISYISKIKSTVRNIAEGNLSNRVPLKYKNELGELAEDINYMASKIEKEEKSRNEFMTNISHDLRTPLTTILGYINMIKNNKYESKGELDNYVDIMDKKGIYLKNMLDDFFEYSKLSSNDIILEKQKLELNELARQIAEEEEDEFTQKGLKLSINLPQESIYIEADPGLFLRAVNNLLSNAFKYSKENTVVEFNISRETFNNTPYAVLSVSNIPNDPISKDDMENFFERLYKKDSSRQKEGSGLGLSIVKNIVKLHGGFVKAYKQDNKLVFKVYNPC
ncbi:HAMP domain-containing sensor histidine kinase [Clostridium coskatii]|uniref:histidine kinase n=1 Tax=Clostridium coskatii TaxID=1705578 RepID=A0A166RPC4_9CLOT|nr:HAMP domain-containing sensor histidine kinase [Clostridium coskatii]OAA90978.1 Signal transduction histidine-protein kinase BaeS [Clostridium coskatii]OBR97019.1 signal transduction histidine-protein kinase BaeS [Clostridium coskatii]